MSVMNLGLEALGIQIEEDKLVSYEYLDAVIEYCDACDTMNIVCDQFDSVLRAAQNLEAVREVVAAEGVTPALEALIGDNFEKGLSLEAIEASMEGVGTAIWEGLKKIWKAIVDFFAKLFGANKGAKVRLQEWIKLAGKKGAKLSNPKEFDQLSAETLKDIKTYVDAIPTKIEKAADGKADVMGAGAKMAAAYGQGGAKSESKFVKHTFSEDGIGAARSYADLLLDALTKLDNGAQKINGACDRMLKALDAADKKKTPADKVSMKDEKGNDVNVERVPQKNTAIEEYKNATNEIRNIINGYLKPLTSATSSFLGANKVVVEKENKAA